MMFLFWKKEVFFLILTCVYWEFVCFIFYCDHKSLQNSPALPTKEMKQSVSEISRNPPGRASKRKRTSSAPGERTTTQSVDLPYDFRYEEIVTIDIDDVLTTVTPAGKMDQKET